jgi:hypothetical protein
MRAGPRARKRPSVNSDIQLVLVDIDTDIYLEFWRTKLEQRKIIPGPIRTGVGCSARVQWAHRKLLRDH